MNLIGHTLGRYHIIEQLGEGGMATVYKAYDTRLETDVAVKVIRTENLPPSGLERALKRFEREAKSLAKLTHPNIVKVMDYGEHEGMPYLVMPYLPGGTLKQLLNGKPMPWLEACKLLIPIVSALDYAHDQGLIHRDVKPSNILLTRKGQPMLTDFGIAKILEAEETTALTGTGMGVGTPDYMAPEQWSGKTSPQTDIYALGVVFYEMVTGRKPYTADTPAAILLKQATEALPRPKAFVPGLPDDVEKALFKALAHKPEDRYASMEAFAQALERIRGGQQVAAPTLVKDNDATIDLPLVKGPIPGEIGMGEDRPNSSANLPQPPVAELQGRQPAGVNPKAPIRKHWQLGVFLGGVALLVVFLAWRLPNMAAQVLPTPTQTSTITASPAPVSTATPPPSSTPMPTATTAPSQTPSLGIGSTSTREKDGMLMVYVPQGKFMMGSDNGIANEKPAHSVTLDAFWIDRTDVTNTMYAGCVTAGVCKPPSSTHSANRVDYYGNSVYDDFPVIYVDWNQAKTYCEWAGARLPSEAEWEKAARGADGRSYPWGEGLDQIRANYNGSDTTKVGSYPAGASSYGALDMAGNVWQWVSDWYGGTYYQNSPSSNPAGPSSGTSRVLRGGAWNDSVNVLRSAVRGRYFPAVTDIYVGFRCARSQ